MTTPITKRQREVLDYLAEHAALSRVRAQAVCGSDTRVAENLTLRGVLNKLYSDHGEVYWIRGEGAPATGASVPAGFVVILHRDVTTLTTPTGRTENFFLARATYDGRGTTFRSLLRGWIGMLGLQSKDLLGGHVGLRANFTALPRVSWGSRDPRRKQYRGTKWLTRSSSCLMPGLRSRCVLMMNPHAGEDP